jgi:hypothetical protein
MRSASTQQARPQAGAGTGLQHDLLLSGQEVDGLSTRVIG